MAELIQVFIAISVTVSFLVMGSAMKHTSKFTPAGVAAREQVRMKTAGVTFAALEEMTHEELKISVEEMWCLKQETCILALIRK